ncbi:MAG: hypothetical protein AAFX56_02865 [Pseudomonadota bacterium]
MAVDKYPRDLTVHDRAHDIAQDTGIPFLGSLTRQLIESPLKKRQLDWFDRVQEVLANHADELEELKRSERTDRIDEVLSIIAQSYSSASKTHNPTKRSWLANSIENSIVSEIDYDVISAYVTIIDYLQPLHIKLLLAFSKPLPLYEKHFETTRSNNVLTLFKQDAGQLRDFVDVAANDLVSRGLIDLSLKSSLLRGRVELVGSATDFGRSFLNFVDETAVAGDQAS